MSKHVKEVFAQMRHVSFLTTIEQGCDDLCGSLEIIVEEQLADGCICTHGCTRYVKICHSRNRCQVYEIEVDETGKGRKHIDGITAVQHVIVEVDADGQQMLNKDMYNIQYYVNDGCSEDDYATIYMSDDPQTQHQEVRIINRRLPQTKLEIFKTKRDQEGNIFAFKGDEQVTLHMCNDSGFEEFITLDQENGYHVTLDAITPGFYHIEECLVEPYNVSYCLNEELETRDTGFFLNAGHNVLQVINEPCIDTQLTIEKYIRKGNGEVSKPGRFECFEVRVISDFFDRVITLHEENDYCVTLYGLEPAVYTVNEIAGEDEVSYSVNGRKEECFAHVEVCMGERANVLVLNHRSFMPCTQQDSPLRICKYVRSCDGMIHKPDASLQFMVTVSGCGMCETFYLNANNNFCVDMASLCQGEYEICEVGCGDYTTSYIINDGMEKTSARICIDGSINYCVSIINEERNRGMVSIHKYICNEYGDLMKPLKHQSFRVVISSYFYKECFELNRDNDWSICISDLRFGSYEVREEACGEYEVTYQVNCEKQGKRARFLIDSCCENEVKIVNRKRIPQCGILKICKFEETNSHEFVKPASDEEFEVEVWNASFHETYSLRASNHWCVMLEGLRAGEYQVREVEHCDYDASYLVNRDEMEEAIVYMGEMNQEVTIINRRKQSGLLKLSATIRNCEGTFVRPHQNTVFEILVEGSKNSYTICLDAYNNWCVLLDQLCEDIYRIIQKDNLGYKVTYQIHGEESGFAKVALGRCDEEVLIINEESNCTGMVKVTKYMEDAQGNLYMPCQGEEYRFELSGRTFTRMYTLRDRNDFCIYFDDLEEGTYEIKEVGDGFAHYRRNGKRVERAQFCLDKEDVHVDIINPEVCSGMVCVEKRIRRDGLLVRPDSDACYRILLKGKNCHEIYELHAGNDFQICFTDLKNQHYEIKELDVSCHLYEVNGVLQEDGYFLYEGDNVEITIINEEALYGNMEIEKKIEDENGDLLRPGRYESFDIVVESEGYKECITLNNDNAFCVRLHHLPQGHYEVSEVCGNGYASYLINGLPCKTACVDVSDLDTCITIINHACVKGCIQFLASVIEHGVQRDPCPGEEFRLIVESDMYQKELCLQECNDFCDQVCELEPATYTIRDAQEEALRFMIDGHTFEDVVCIELEGEHVCVHVTRVLQEGAAITIRKCMEDAFGEMHEPMQEEAFGIILLHNGRKQMFTLNCENHWTKTLTKQGEGTYEIKEVDGGEHVRFQVDGQCPTSDGYFEVCQNNMEVVVVNTMNSQRYLHLQSCIQDKDEHILTPQDDMVFYMHVESSHTQKTFVLNAQNRWHQSVEVEVGAYTITQNMDPSFQEVYYVVDNEKLCQVVVEVENHDLHIQSINVIGCQGGCIELASYKRDVSCGCYRRPASEDVYEVEIRGKGFHNIITLDKENHWKEKLENVSFGIYDICVLGETQKIYYIVNEGQEKEHTQIEIQEEAQRVRIIHEEGIEHTGSIEICKLLKDREGCYRFADQDESFWVSIKGEMTTSKVLLNHANHFYASIRNLAPGWYEVCEENDTAGVTYVINNGEPVGRGVVEVKQNANTVNIINPCTACGGRMELSAYIQQGEGLLMKPETGEYRMHISKVAFNKIIVLNKENGYRALLEQLEDGDYVIDELDRDNCSYIVDGGSQVDYAVVRVCGNEHQVQVMSRQKGVGQGSISIAKYMREGQQLNRPSGEERFIFHIAKPGFQQFYTLDKNNQFMQTIEHLEEGEYLIRETTTLYDVSYMINGQGESGDGIVPVYGNHNTVQIINTKRTETGSIHLKKFIRKGQELVKPSPGFVCVMHISKPGYNETFLLQEDNQWSYDVMQLSPGVYVVDEVGEESLATYIVNGGSEVNRAIVNVDQNQNDVQIINQQRDFVGSIRVVNYIRNEQQQLVSPPAHFVVHVHVSKSGYNELFTLNQANAWQVILPDMVDGDYVIDEVDHDDRVGYIIDGGSEVAYGIVHVQKDAHVVQMIHPMEHTKVVQASSLFESLQAQVATPVSSVMDTGRLEINKYIKQANGTLIRPADGDVYVVEIRGGDVVRNVQLNAGNMFTAVLRDLPAGQYVVREVSTNDPYVTTYRVNGGDEADRAIVTMDEGVHNVVDIMNELRENRNTIEVFKYMLDKDGNYLPPMSGQTFQFRIVGNDVDNIYDLNVDNNWHQSLSTLPSGEYQVQEIGSPYQVKYIVNSAQLREEARFLSQPGETNIIGIINLLATVQDGRMTLTKWIRNAQGDVERPSGESFVFHVTSDEFDQYVTLNEDNRYAQELTNLAYENYQIEETSGNYQVRYRVNGGQESTQGIVTVNSGGANHIMIINEKRKPILNVSDNNKVKVIIE